MKKDKNTRQQRVRVLQTGELGTVTDQVLMRRGGKPMLYRQVRIDSNPHIDHWYWADQLGSVRETCRITLADDRGAELYIKVTHDHEGRGSYEFEASARPASLKEHDLRGLPFLLTGALLKGLGVHNADLSAGVNGGPVKTVKF